MKKNYQCSEGVSTFGSSLIPPRYSDCVPLKKEQVTERSKTIADTKDRKQANHSGLLHYRKWWERVNVELLVNGKVIIGVPIFIEENTLRIVNSSSSYFVPLEKVDYIRTADGLGTCTLPSDKAVVESLESTPNT